MTEQENPAPNADAPDEEDTLRSQPDEVDDAVIEDEDGDGEADSDEGASEE